MLDQPIPPMTGSGSSLEPGDKQKVTPLGHRTIASAIRTQLWRLHP
jgi:hypothetical protein